MDLNKVKQILSENGLNAKKQFGQNFLVDNNILNKIANSANLTCDSVVVEIGPGMGALTEKLLEKANKVICYEIDKDMVNILNNRFNHYLNNRLTINYKDFLKADLKKELEGYQNIKVVANLPYYITTPILIKICEELPLLDEMIVMMQKEVALRICGKPSTKDYNALSVLIQYNHEATLLFDVHKGCFYPEPDVTSSIVRIKKISPRIKPINEEFFYTFNRNIFRQRRKTLVNNLKQAYSYTKDQIEEVLNKLNLSLTIRSEALSVEQIINLSDEFFKLK